MNLGITPSFNNAHQKNNANPAFGAVVIEGIDHATIDALRELKPRIAALKNLVNMNLGDSFTIRSAVNPDAEFTNLGLFGVYRPEEELANKDGVLFVFPEETEKVMNHLTDSQAMDKELDNIIKAAKRINATSIKAKIIEIRAQMAEVQKYSPRNKNTRLKEVAKLEAIKNSALHDLGLEYTA